MTSAIRAIAFPPEATISAATVSAACSLAETTTDAPGRGPPPLTLSGSAGAAHVPAGVSSIRIRSATGVTTSVTCPGCVSEIVKATSVCLGAFVDDALVAYVIVSRYVDAWHVMNLVVAPEHQRQGIATRLLVALLDRTAEDASRGFTLEVRVSNDAAIKLYESMGFRAQGVRRGYYTDNREDALIMWRDPADP